MFANILLNRIPFKKQGPIEKPEKTRNNNIVDLVCDWLVTCMVNFWKRYAQKLRNLILLQFELISVRFAYGRTRKPLISMISGFSDVSLSPKTIYLHLLRDQKPQNNSRKSNIIFEKRICLNIELMNFVFLKMLETQAAGNPEDPSNMFLKNLEYGINIFLET